MKIIKQGDSKVTKIINKKKLNDQAQYHLSLFIYLYSEDSRYLIQNTLSLEVVELTKNEWESIKLIKDSAVGFDFIIKNGLEQLVLSRYIVETEYDEIKQYQQLIFIFKSTLNGKNGLKTYIILPTTGCNARCVYCYEEGFPVKNMSFGTADKLIDYICKTRHDDTIKLKWFGGEPLVGANIIRHICNALQDRGVPYRSGMITNASLMTKELAHEAKELWHLEKVQVSLDGARSDYEERKKYYSPEKYNYDVVMRAIHYLADEDIKVVLRVNFDGENLPRLRSFLDDIKNEFGDMKNIIVYFRVLYQEREKEGFLDLQKKAFELYDYAKSIGIPTTDESKRKSKFKVNGCMADSLDKSVVITPDGIFNNCEHLPENNTWGNIFDGVTDQARFDELSAPPKIDEKCAKCLFLPECTPFYKNGCPGWFEKCYEYHCLKTEHMLHNLLKGVNTENDDDLAEI